MKKSISKNKLNLLNREVYTGFWSRISIQVFICLLIIFSQPSLAQTGKSSAVKMKVTDIGINNARPGNVTENKSIGFFITGMKSEDDAGTIENLLYKQKGIYSPRASYNASYCAFVVLKESGINEAFVKNLLESAGFGINNYLERISKNLINKKVDKPIVNKLTPQ
ncbi:MAG: hypothetical protein COC01_09185 [Bacteroidetes bacterium]|nr:MAG: hypothetical protein COC01_09185 [Bacteroidota bacterium]